MKTGRGDRPMIADLIIVMVILLLAGRRFWFAG